MGIKEKKKTSGEMRGLTRRDENKNWDEEKEMDRKLEAEAVQTERK